MSPSKKNETYKEENSQISIPESKGTSAGQTLKIAQSDLYD
jgi:hypothetical protein